ncbi:MAG TPA: zinc ABC transporter substrate-binding protein [Thermoanaerobaculia bacterium]|nr:zinc ABC transporter substrate-binding protein [Thermoanaerobaculia bacterium]
MPKSLLWLVLILPLAACGGPAGEGPSSPEGLRVVATTGMVADAAREILGDAGTVEALMGPGVDPHLYKASESDVRRLAGADLILVNGLHLEGKMGDILEKMAATRPVVAVGAAVPVSELREPPGMAGQHDPHLWFDVRLWSNTLGPITEALVKLVPAKAEAFRANAERYRGELAALDAWVESRIAEIPPEGRVLVTAHDAFGYFGRRYGIDVVGLQGISTLAEAGLSDVDRMVELVVSRKVKAIFVESSVPRRSIEAVQNACRARGHQVAIGGQLYSDALGAAGTPAGTYLGMVRANVETIVTALK